MRLKLERAVVWIAQGRSGEIRLHQVGEPWNGLRELQDAKGQKVIVAGLDGAGWRASFGDVFDQIFGQGSDLAANEVVIVSGSPDLVAELTPLPAKGA